MRCAPVGRRSCRERDFWSQRVDLSVPGGLSCRLAVGQRKESEVFWFGNRNA
jgi:hypothetical protein